MCTCLLVSLLISSATGYRLFSISGSRRLPRGDDNSILQRMRQPFRFYGTRQQYIRVSMHTQFSCIYIYIYIITIALLCVLPLQIYNNGYVSLGTGTTGGSTPRPFPFRGAPMIAPYWANVDTRATGVVYYRSSTSYNELYRTGRLISSTYHTSFHPTSLFIVTWYGVGAYYQSKYPVCIIHI